MGKLRLRVRFDYAGKGKAGLFGGKNSADIAEATRQQQASLSRNVPIQGIVVEDIDMSQEVYTIHDEVSDKTVSFAPVNIIFSADSIEDAIRFTMKEEFRKVEVLEPEELNLSRLDMERIFLRVNEELRLNQQILKRKMDNWK